MDTKNPIDEFNPSHPNTNTIYKAAAIVAVLGLAIVGYQMYQNNGHGNGDHDAGDETYLTGDGNDLEYQKGNNIIAKAKSQPDLKGNIVSLVGNQGDPAKAWNDTPTVGMVSGGGGTLAPMMDGPAYMSPKGSLLAPGGLPPGSPLACRMPTGYLLQMAKCWQEGKTEGIHLSAGLEIDMGHGDGAFYDTIGDGCCDTFCRRVMRGGYWSCISPNSITTQYTQATPRGTKCNGYGRHDGSGNIVHKAVAM